MREMIDERGVCGSHMRVIFGNIMLSFNHMFFSNFDSFITCLDY